MGFGEDGLLYRIVESVKYEESRKFRWKNPDLICVHNKFGVIIVEVDGAVHDKKVQKTLERNELYRKAGIKLIVLNIRDIKESGKNIFQTLDCDLDRLLGGKCEKH